MNRTIFACLILVLVALRPAPAHAQSASVQAHNAYIMDSLQMEVLTVWCQGKIDSPQTYNHRKTRQLTDLLQTMSTLYDDSLTRNTLAARLKRFREGNISVDTVNLGGLSIITVYVELERYLRAKLQFSCIGDYVVAQRYELQPVTLTWCSDHAIGFFDFNFCRAVYAENISFPLRYTRNDYFYSVRLSPVNRRAAAADWPQYALYLSLDSTGDPHTDRLLAESYFVWNWDTYRDDRPDHRFLELARSANKSVLTGMLYSPNYYYAVNAMEALIYLAASQQLTLDADVLRRIDQLKNATSPIRSQHSDVVYRRNGYADLKISDEQVIAKYRTALAASAK